MNCMNCGAPITAGQEFCGECGARIGYEPAKQTLASPYVQQTTQYAQSGPVGVDAQPSGRRSVAVPVLAALCSVLAMALVGVVLVATGVIHVGGPQSGDVVTDAQTTPSRTAQDGPAGGNDTQGTVIVDMKKDEKKSVEKQDAKEQATGIPTTDASQPVASQQVTPVQDAPTPVQDASAPAQVAPAASQSSGFLLPDSATHYYTVEELSELSDWELYIARNEIYARRGRGFIRQNLRDYFATCSWYVECYDPEYFDEHVEPTMSDCEKANITTILDYEHLRGSPYP